MDKLLVLSGRNGHALIHRSVPRFMALTGLKESNVSASSPINKSLRQTDRRHIDLRQTKGRRIRGTWDDVSLPVESYNTTQGNSSASSGSSVSN